MSYPMMTSSQLGPYFWLVILVVSISACNQNEVGQVVPDSAVKNEKKLITQAPEVAWTELDGNKQTVSAFRGQVTIIDFWATWCGPCKVAIPDLNDLYAAYKDQGLVIVGVSIDKNVTPTELQSFIDEYRITYPVVMGDRAVEEAYGQVMSPAQQRVTSLPTTFILDRQGRVIKHYIGYRADVSKLELENEIRPLL